MKRMLWHLDSCKGFLTRCWQENLVGQGLGVLSLPMIRRGKSQPGLTLFLFKSYNQDFNQRGLIWKTW